MSPATDIMCHCIACQVLCISNPIQYKIHQNATKICIIYIDAENRYYRFAGNSKKQNNFLFIKITIEVSTFCAQMLDSTDMVCFRALTQSVSSILVGIGYLYRLPLPYKNT